MLLGGADTPSKRVFSAARVGVDVVIMVASLLGALFGVSLVAPWIGGGVIGVALSTLALSGGVFLAAVIFQTKMIKTETREGTIWAAVIVAASFLASSALAEALGQPAPDFANPAFSDLIQEAVSRGSIDARLVVAALAVVGYVLFGSAQVYGAVGAFFLSCAGCLSPGAR